MKEILIEKKLRQRILGCAMRVMNVLGNGFREKTYEKALKIEFQEENLSIECQKAFPVYYKQRIIDSFVPDLIVEDKIIVELKTVEKICDEHIGQLLNYLKVTNLKVGLIINFKHSKLEWKSVVN